MNQKINALFAGFKFFFPRALLLGVILAFVTWFYLAFVCSDWTLDYFAFTFGCWVLLWTFAGFCLLPKLLRH